MRLIPALILLALSVSVPTAARSMPPEGLSAADLGFDCQRVDRETQRTCELVILSVLEAHNLMATAEPRAAVFCANGAQVDVAQAKALFIGWVNRNRPRTLMVSAGVGVLAALREWAPCP